MFVNIDSLAHSHPKFPLLTMSNKLLIRYVCGVGGGKGRGGVKVKVYKVKVMG